ncbi:hypothetical protein Agabi119p4_573 [Agaricus bisporus var. burnettii]|uniref:Uncharacterized protein n=1 Tax=Agaricus bisporus var. burnettii TaxID=192524 RepID=A0A8H7FAV1_AGABI|nr:hypothetical protein Agabi119p4_573 [Agaricus bisporus var. burnettii]
MATVSPKPPPSKRQPTSPPHTPSITRGATARSAVSPRVSAGVRRTPSKVAHHPAQAHEDTREALAASLKEEIDQKEQLLLQLQDKDQTIRSLTGEAEGLTSSLHTTEARLNELYNEQARSETELAQRIEVAEKLRTQVRELEREKRDLQRRYNEQTATFEAERQAFYDNEQHLKSKIQSVSEALKRSEEAARDIPEPAFETFEEQEIQSKPIPKPPVAKQDVNDSECEPAEMTALKLELSTLSTSHSSLQSTLLLLQSQLLDLKRVNHELQEDNESYMILLREKTLSGQFDPMRQVGAGNSSSDDDDDGDGSDVEQPMDMISLRSAGRSNLDPVDEEVEGAEAHTEVEVSLEDDSEEPQFSRQSSRQGRKRTGSTHEPRGESLADLPITGPGLDLAAELGRAENKDVLDGTTNIVENNDPGKSKRNKKGSDGRKVSISTDGGHHDSGVSAEMETMRTEIKSLKDANKALSLYASKIIDRIIAQEGFEHVLAADYDKESQIPPSKPSAKDSPVPPHQPRPLLGKSASVSSAPATDSTQASSNPSPSPRLNVPTTRANRRSLSFDWKSFSIFNNSTEKKPDSNLRPLTLKPGTSTLSGARKLDTEEDDDDRRERERLNATMQLMGIQPAPQSPIPASVVPATPIERTQSETPTTTINRRFSFFGFGAKNTDTNSDGASVHSTPAVFQNQNGQGDPVNMGVNGSVGLTEEALERAEAENSLAALDARERSLSVELAKGGSSGFTEIAPRPSRRRRRSVGGSGSTVWSAGMSAGDE